MDNLYAIWKRAQAGDCVGARREVVALLRTAPKNTTAWLLLAELVEDPTYQAECYHRVLHLEPGNVRARARLDALTAPGENVVPRSEARIPSLFDDEELQAMAEDLESEEALMEALDALEEAPPTPIEEEISLPSHQMELADFVVYELGNLVYDKDIIRKLCDLEGMSWPEAEAFVEQVKQSQRKEIAKREGFWVLVLAIPTMIAGIVLLFFARHPVGLLMILGGLIGILRIWYASKPPSE